jgi:hypothetical protein
VRGHEGHACSGEVLLGDGESVLFEYVLGERVVSAADLGWGVRRTPPQRPRSRRRPRPASPRDASAAWTQGPAGGKDRDGANDGDLDVLERGGQGRVLTDPTSALFLRFSARHTPAIASSQTPSRTPAEGTRSASPSPGGVGIARSWQISGARIRKGLNQPTDYV